MYSDIFDGLEKIRRDARFLRDTWKLERGGEIAGFVLPAPVHRIVPTCYVINIASLLDEAFEIYININFAANRKDIARLEQKIDYLDKKGKLISPVRLHEIRRKRNEYAHDPSRYSTWEEMDTILKDVEDELRPLEII